MFSDIFSGWCSHQLLACYMLYFRHNSRWAIRLRFSFLSARSTWGLTCCFIQFVLITCSWPQISTFQWQLSNLFPWPMSIISVCLQYLRDFSKQSFHTFLVPYSFLFFLRFSFAFTWLKHSSVSIILLAFTQGYVSNPFFLSEYNFNIDKATFTSFLVHKFCWYYSSCVVPPSFL